MMPRGRPKPCGCVALVNRHTSEVVPYILPTTGFVRLRQVLQVIPVARSTWYQGIKEGRYPKGVQLGPRTVAWKVQDIHQLIRRLGDEEEF